MAGKGNFHFPNNSVSLNVKKVRDFWGGCSDVITKNNVKKEEKKGGKCE